MSRQHNILKATYSCQNPGFQSDINEKKPQCRRTISYNDYFTLPEEELPEQKPTSPLSSITDVSIPIPEPIVPIIHREMKSGRQRFRWNLIFNVLVWIICPLPIWLPFLSNQLSIYLLTFIQFIFVFIWFIISLLAARNAFLIFRFVNKTFFFLN
jgi:hypothetical protein